MLSCLFAFMLFVGQAEAEANSSFEETLNSESFVVAPAPHTADSDNTQIKATDTSIRPLVQIRSNGGGFELYRRGEPYYIKGVGGTRFIEEAYAAGANSVRTWSAKNIDMILDRSEKNHMTVLLGIWLSHDPSDYRDDAYKKRTVARVENLLNQHKDHPALLMWALGNEINLRGNDSPEAWQFVNSLARMIKAHDVHHPVISVISFRKETLDKIAEYAPDIDAVGINAYAALSKVREMVEASEYQGPYLITEWGVTGHWEVERTQWGRPIEPTSAQKAELYRHFYVQDILKNKDRCLGSYVFLWGQKQERTPTWYSMFIESIPGIKIDTLTCATVDVMNYNWSGAWPANRAPEVTAMTINGITAYDNVSLYRGQEMVIKVAAGDPDQEPLNYIWEILEEPVKLGVGGSREPRPTAVGEALLAETPAIQIPAPKMSGLYRLFVYVVDKQGRVGTANIPFQVDTYQANGETAVVQ